MSEICKCCWKLFSSYMQIVSDTHKKTFHDLIIKFELEDGLICNNCEFMLTSFTDFKAMIVKNHEKIAAVVKGDPAEEKKKDSPQPRRKLGISTANIKLPAGISIKPARKQTLVPLKDSDELKIESDEGNFESVLFKTEPKFEDVIELSDDSDDDNGFQADVKDESDAESEIFEVTEEPPRKTRHGYLFRMQNFNIPDKLTLKKPRDPSKRRYTGLKNRIIVTCDTCGFKTHKGFFRNHFKLAHLKESKRLYSNRTDAAFSCDKCPKRFMTRDNMIHHQNFKHPDKGEFTCTNCYSKFSSLSLMKEHQRNFKCYKRQGYRYRKTSEQVLCMICGLLTEKGTLSKHVARVHKKQKNFSCQFCGNTYENNTVLHNHILSKHNHGIKNFQCDLCDHRSATKVNLRRHLVNIHIPKKLKHRCQICLKGFLFTPKYNRHMQTAHPPDEIDDGFRVNLATNNFPCPNCDKEFRRKINLHMHINCYHKPKAPKVRKRKNNY